MISQKYVGFDGDGPETVLLAGEIETRRRSGSDIAVLVGEYPKGPTDLRISVSRAQFGAEVCLHTSLTVVKPVQSRHCDLEPASQNMLLCLSSMHSTNVMTIRVAQSS